MTTNKPAKYNPLISLARQAKRRNMDMQCDPQWVLDLADECEKLRKDAERYRWLREQHWSTGDMAVLTSPKSDAKLGAWLPSGRLLDIAIDSAMQEDA